MHIHKNAYPHARTHPLSADTTTNTKPPIHLLPSGLLVLYAAYTAGPKQGDTAYNAACKPNVGIDLRAKSGTHIYGMRLPPAHRTIEPSCAAVSQLVERVSSRSLPTHAVPAMAIIRGVREAKKPVSSWYLCM